MSCRGGRIEGAVMGAAAVRASTEADLPAVQAIYAHHVLHGTASFEEVPPELPEIARRRAAILDRGLPYLVAEAGDHILGYAYAGPYRDRSAYRFALEDSVYVAADALGHGVGRMLLGALVARAEASGYRQMLAVIGDSGNHASIALHESAGFRHIGTFAAIGFKFGRWLDVVMMQRQLGPGDAAPPEA